MTTQRSVSEDELHGYADGRLAPERVEQVEAALARDSDAAARVAAIRAENEALRRTLDPWLAEPVPARLLAAATRPASRVRWSWWRPGLALAATLVVGIAIGWFGRETLLARQGTPTSFAREAAFSHVIYARDQGRPVEVGAADEARLVRWLTRRLGVEIAAPDLAGVGFSLVGGRLVAGNEKPTALLMYENADKQRLTLQWRKNDAKSREAAFRYAVERGVGVFYWVDDNCAYALSGDVDRTRLLAAAHVVHGQLVAGYAQHLQR